MKSKIFNDLNKLFEDQLLLKKEYYDFFDFNKFDFLLRAQMLLQFGRFWAEEGERWFRVAQRSSTFEMLTYAAKNDNINMFFTNFIFSIVKFIPKVCPIYYYQLI